MKEDIHIFGYRLSIFLMNYFRMILEVEEKVTLNNALNNFIMGCANFYKAGKLDDKKLKDFEEISKGWVTGITPELNDFYKICSKYKRALELNKEGIFLASMSNYLPVPKNTNKELSKIWRKLGGDTAKISS